MSEVLIAIIAGLVAMFGWGFGDVIAKPAIDKTGALIASFLMAVGTFIFMFPFLLVDSSTAQIVWPNIGYIFLAAIVDVVMFLILFQGYKVGKVSVIGPIVATYGVVAAIVSFLFFGEDFTVLKGFVIFVMLIGIFLTSLDLKGLKDGLQSGDFAKGLGWAFLFFLIAGTYIPFWDRIIDGEGWVFTALLTKLFGVLIYTSIVLGAGKFRVISKMSFKYIGLMLSVGLIYAISNSAFNWGLSTTNETSLLAAISTTYPVIMAISAYFLLKERIAFNQYVGIVIIVFGVVLATLL